jgi:nucleotide-binding universal stress UspA family protein
MRTLQHRITFGDDHSPGADVAWGWICAQTWPGWTVDVVTVTAPAPDITSLFTHEPLHTFTPDRPRVAVDSTELAAMQHLTTAYDPRVILTEKHDSDLLVVGARGRGLLKTMHIGSTAEWLMRCPSTPLLIARAALPVRSVLVAVDGSSHSAAAVDALSAMPWVAGCEVTVISVLGGDSTLRDGALEAQRTLQAAGASATVRLLDIEPTALTMNPTLRILDAIDELSPDLVALGTQGRTGMPRLMVGSVAGAVTHAATCSVLLARDASQSVE